MTKERAGNIEFFLKNLCRSRDCLGIIIEQENAHLDSLDESTAHYDSIQDIIDRMNDAYDSFNDVINDIGYVCDNFPEVIDEQ